MENNLSPKEKNNTPKDKKQIILYTAIGLLSAGLLVAGFFLFLNKKEDPKAKNVSKTDSIYAKKDSLSTAKIDSTLIQNNDEEGEEGESYGYYVYVGKGQMLGEKKINFGDKIFVDYQLSDEQRKVIYTENPYEKKNLPTYSISAESIIDESTFESYKKNFSLPPFNSLSSAVKDLILDNDYNNGHDYSITQNAERAKFTICYGDFDGDNSKDVAVLLDNNEKQISRLLVICNNSVTKKPYLGFAENYSDKMKINSYRKGASIIIDNELQASEIDGIIIKGEDVKIAVSYDKDLQKFKTYYQEINSEEE